jgi:hypothetical protein
VTPPARGRRTGAAVRPIVPAPAAPAGGRYVSLDALRAALDGAEWAPLRLATGGRERPASPRLPHALLLHLAQAARECTGVAAGAAPSIAPTPLRPDLPRLEALLGADRALVAGALDALARAGLVEAGDASDPAGHLRLTAAALGADPRCAALDWRALAAATAGSPTAWVAAHALAERLTPYDWTPVPRGGLERVLGCGVSGVRAALERLAAAEVVERREQRGGVSVYRFTDLAWGAGGEGAPTGAPARAFAPAPPSAPARRVHAPDAAGRAAPGAATPTPGAPPAATGEAAAGVRLVVGGVELELPAGCRARVVIGADGRPTVTLGGAHDER